eukprot:13010019-Heterocapsa_arctica.AAC.1
MATRSARIVSGEMPTQSKTASFIGAVRGLRGLRRPGRVQRTVCSNTAGRPAGPATGATPRKGASLRPRARARGRTSRAKRPGLPPQQ